MYNVSLIDIEEYKKILNENVNVNISFFNAPTNVIFYPKVNIVKISKRDDIIAIFPFSVIEKDGKKMIRRPFRLLPYLSPIFFKKNNNFERKSVCFSLFKFLFDKYDVVYIPLNCSFNDIMSLQANGAFIEQRTTHIIEKSLDLSKLNSTLKNHIYYAKKHVYIKIEVGNCDFNFQESICGDKDDIKIRANFGRHLLKTNQAFVINAYDKNNINIAGVFIAYDKESAYLLHSWRNKESPRGCIQLLIYEATIHAFSECCVKEFDFEGSVINSIDNFFSEFDAKLTCYPFVHYAKDKFDLYKLIETSLNINGRIEQQKVNKDDNN